MYIVGYVAEEHCMTNLYHAIENSVDNTITVTCAAHDGKVGCVVIGCDFFGVV